MRFAVLAFSAQGIVAFRTLAKAHESVDQKQIGTSSKADASIDQNATNAHFDVCRSFGAPVLIQSHRGEYLEDRFGVVGVAADTRRFQKWKIERSGDDGLVFIQSHRGEYLEDRVGVVGVHTDMGPWQKWKIERSGDDDLVFIQSHRGEYLEDRAGVVGVHPAMVFDMLYLGPLQKWKVTTEDGSLACGVSEALCTCTTPNAGTVGHNQYTCDDGTSAWCSSHQECYATSSFTKGDWQSGCGSRQSA